MVTALPPANGHAPQPSSKMASGSSSSASSAEQVEQLGAQTLEQIVAWISRGESDPSCPVTEWPTPEEARANVRLPLLQEQAGEETRGKLVETVQSILANSVNPWTGRFLDKLYCAPDPIGIVADLLLSALNANGHVMSASPALTLIEETCVREIARLCGWVGSSASAIASAAGEPDLVDGLTMPAARRQTRSRCRSLCRTTSPATARRASSLRPSTSSPGAERSLPR